MTRTKSLALCLSLLLLCLPLSATAAKNEAAAAAPDQHAAQLLYQLGLFRGVSEAEGTPDFALDRKPSREEAVTMLVRLLGKDAEAQSANYTHPFSDVSDWAKPYVAYAYQNRFALGTGDHTFGGRDAVNTAQYLTFILRALGYSSDSDFHWTAPWELSDALSITFGDYTATTRDFDRGDVAILSAAALSAPMKNTEQTLLSYLNTSGALAKDGPVILNLEVVSCQKNSMRFAFFPLTGSPQTYESFRLDTVTVNGLPCTVTQYENGSAAKAAAPSIGILYPESFNYSVLSYDEAAAKAAATHTTEVGGKTFPVLVFSFTCTGTLPNGDTVSETFSEAVYIDGYGVNG